MTRTPRLIAAALFASLGAAALAGALPARAETVILLPQPGVPSIAAPAPIVRPTIHSYQPYGNLQSGFRPDPPAVRGTDDGRPQVILPKRLAPLVGGGAGAAKWYSYCGSHTNADAELASKPRCR